MSKNKHRKPAKRRLRKYCKKMQHSRKKMLRNFNLTARKITIGIIVVAVAAVAATFVAQKLLDPETRVSRGLETLTADYYEDYYYGQFTATTDDAAALMQKYAKNGLARIQLRQLLLSDVSSDKELEELIREYCDVDASYVRYFPVAPYGATDYVAEYDYSCNF